MEILRSQSASKRGPSQLFTGTVWIDTVAHGEDPSRLRALSVHFEPGARTAWHSHPVGQVLHVTEGRGRVQSRGGPVQSIRVGDTVLTPPEEWHWHGASPESLMTHLALQEAGPDGAEAKWGDHVSDSDYSVSPKD
jgi:quercetin dioxygenase-like cupin family protein